MIRFKFLVGDINWYDYGGKWISQKLKDEFEFHYVLELINMHESTGDKNQDQYVVCVDMVSVSQATKEQWKSAMDCHGYTEDSMEWTEELKVEVLHGYGASANIIQLSGDNCDKLLRQAKKEVQKLEPKVELAKPKNMIGSNGYDFLKGNILAGLTKRSHPQQNLFEFSEATVEDGRVVKTKTKMVDKSKLTSECWLIQIKGIDACKKCELKNTSECGGQKIRKKLLTA